MLTHEEKKYPIYKFKFKWHQEGFENNATGFERMFKIEPTTEELQKIVDKQVEHINEKYKVTEWLQSEYKFFENESWVISWFNHITYNLYETDEEVERSFRDFVERKRKLNLSNGHYQTEMNFDSNLPFYCLMGAEDYYRWKVCRCEHCLAQGKITVDH